MEVSGSSRSRSKKDAEERVEARQSSRIEDNEDWDGSDMKKHRSSRSHKHGSQEDAEEQDSGRRRSSGDRMDVKKKSGSSSQAGSGDEDDFDVRRESRSKIPRKSLDARSEMRTSEGYRDRELDGSRRSREDEHGWSSSKRSSSKPSGDHEGSSQGKSGSKVESSYEKDIEKGRDYESRYSERKENSREKDYGRQEQGRDPPRRRSDEVETGRRAEENDHGDRKGSDHYKHGNSRERSSDLRNDSADARTRIMELTSGKGGSREDKRTSGERGRSLTDAQGEDSRGETTPREARDDKQRKARERPEDQEPFAHALGARSSAEKTDKNRRDEFESRDRPGNLEEDGPGHIRDTSGRDTRSKRSQSPERSGRYHRDFDEHDRGFLESDMERNIGMKGKERNKDDINSKEKEYRDDMKGKERDYRDDRPFKGKDNWEVSKDHWRSSQSRHDVKDGDDAEYDSAKEWDSQRHEKERMIADKLYGRSGYRKDNRVRQKDSKGSTNSGAMLDHSDTIEIRPNRNFDFGREESISTLPGRRTGAASLQDFGSRAASEEEWEYPSDDRFPDDITTLGQGSRRNSLDSLAGRGRGQKGAGNLSRTGSGHSATSGGHLLNSQGSSSFNRAPQPGQKGGRLSRGRGRPPDRDTQRAALPLQMMPPSFPLNLPSGPGLAHSPGPPISPNVFISPFPGPIVWPGARDLSMLAVPPNLPPIPPPGPGGPRFGPNIGNGPSHPMFFNQQGSGRGVVSNLPGPLFNPMGPVGRDVPSDKPSGGWGQTRSSGPSGKAPSRGEQNDYSQNFVDTGTRPQNFIRELELTSVVEDYPKLRELIQRKDEIVAKSASPPMYYKCDLKEHVLSSEFFGTKFDVILVDPPWEEYVHRAPGVTDHLEYWTFEEIQNLRIEAVADTPSFIFLWVGDGVGLEQGRQCLKKWGFRRCEDICWIKTNKKNAAPGLRHDSHTLFQHSKEHCLMGIKGTVRRSTDGHIIHANIDTDIIIAEEPADGSTRKPDDMYRIIEHFSLGRRRLELFGEDHNIRSGWLTVGKGLSSSNFNAEGYVRNFADMDGKVWHGGGGRNPPPEAPHLVLTTPEIEGLRPKSPPAKSQQQQPISLLSAGSSNNRRASGNSSQNPNATPFPVMKQDPSSSEPPNQLVPWAGSPMLRGPEGGTDDKFYDGFGLNPSCTGQVVGDHIEFDPRRTFNMNMM